MDDREHRHDQGLPDSADAFTRLGIVRDGISKRMEYAVENVFEICAMLEHLGVPGTDEDVVDHLTVCSAGRCSRTTSRR